MAGFGQRWSECARGHRALDGGGPRGAGQLDENVRDVAMDSVLADRDRGEFVERMLRSVNLAERGKSPDLDLESRDTPRLCLQANLAQVLLGMFSCRAVVTVIECDFRAPESAVGAMLDLGEHSLS